MAEPEAQESKGRLAGAAAELTVWLAAGLIAFTPFARGLIQGRCFFFRDLARYFFPVRHFFTEGLLHGELRLWNPFVHEGFSDLPLVFYPLDLLQLLRNDEWTYSLLLALHVALAAAAMSAFVRSLGAGRTAAVGGGVLYALSGFGLSLLNLDIALRAYALVPLLALTMRRAACGGHKDIAVAAFVCAAALSTLSPEILLQGVLLSLAVSMWPLSWQRLRRLLMALILAAGLASAPLLLEARLIPDSARGSLLATQASLHRAIQPIAWLQMIVGSLFGDLSQIAVEWWGYKHFSQGFPYILSLYVGLTTLALCAAGLLGGVWMRKRVLGILIVGVALCLGDVLGLGGVLSVIPVLRLFRYPVKAFFAVQFALTLMAAGGLDALARNNRPTWRVLCVAATVVGGVLFLVRFAWIAPASATLGWFRGFFPDALTIEAQQARIDFILQDASLGGGIALATGLVAFAVLVRRLRPQAGAALACAMMAADLLRAGAGLNPMVTRDYYRLSDEAARVYGTIKDKGGRVFTCDILAQRAYAAARPLSHTKSESYVYAAMMESATPHTNVAFGIPTALSEDLFGLVPVGRTLADDELTCHPFEGIRERLRLAGVTHVISADALVSASLRPMTTIYAARLAPLGLHVYALSDPLPRFELARLVHVAKSAEEAQALALSTVLQEPGTVAIEAPVAPNGAAGRAKLLAETPGHLQLEVEAEGRTVLVVRDGFDSAWRASVNGGRVPVWRANARHLAIPVPAGLSRVELRHRPWQLGAGLALGGLSAIVLAGLWLRRKPAGEATVGRLS